MASKASPRGLPKSDEASPRAVSSRLKLGNCLCGTVVVQHAAGRLDAGRRGELVFVVLQQQAPGVGVASNEVQHLPPGGIHQRLVAQRAGQQIQGVAGFLESAFGEALLVEGEATDQVVAQGAGGPLAKVHAALGIDAVTDGDDGVEVVVSQRPSDPTTALGSNYREILGSCLPLQLLGAEDVSSDAS